MIVIVSLLFIFLFFPTSTHAANYHLSISPPVLEIITKPNKSFIHAFTLKNLSSSPITLVPKIIQIKPLDNKGHVAPTNLQPVNNLPLKFSLENSNLTLNHPFTIPPNQTQQLILRLTSANLNQPQDFYLALALTPPNLPTTKPLSQPVLTALLFVTITPNKNLPINLTLQNFTLPKFYDSSTPLHLQPQLYNNSNTMIRPKTNLTIKNWRNHTIFSLNLASNLILSHTSRLLHPPKSTFIFWQPPRLALGPYQFSLTVTSQNNQPLIQETKTVFLFPIKYTLYLIVGSLIFLLFLSTKSAKIKELDSN